MRVQPWFRTVRLRELAVIDAGCLTGGSKKHSKDALRSGFTLDFFRRTQAVRGHDDFFSEAEDLYQEPAAFDRVLAENVRFG